METFATDRDKLAFLLESEAELLLPVEHESATGDVSDSDYSNQATAKEKGSESSEDRPKYITNYIGSKQKLVDWIWQHTPDDIKAVADAFSGSSVVAYMYKTKGLTVHTNGNCQERCHFLFA